MPSMLSGWLTSLANIVAPPDPDYDEKIKAAEASTSDPVDLEAGPSASSPLSPSSEPIANGNNEMPAVAVAAAAASPVPPLETFLSPSIRNEADSQYHSVESTLCTHCNKMTPYKTPARPQQPDSANRPQPQNDAFEMQSPKNSEAIANNSSIEASLRELEAKVLKACRGVCDSMASPPAVQETRSKIFRLCGSTRPLSEKLVKKLTKLLSDNSTLCQTRSVRMGAVVPDGYTPVMACAYSGNEAAIEICLELDPESHLQTDRQGQTALHIAADNGYVEIVVILMDHHDGRGEGVDALLDLAGKTPFGALLVSKNPKLKPANKKKIKDRLFSPKDRSLIGSPPPQHTRTKVVPSLNMAWGKTEMPGYRVAMEDAICEASWQNHLGSNYALLGVCDGHGDGGLVSHFVALHLASAIRKRTMTLGLDDERTDWLDLWTGACLDVDRRVKRTGLVGGSTAVLALITRTQIIVANVGDSRSILVQSPPVTSTTDQGDLPELVEETKAITSEVKQTEAVDSTEDDFVIVALSEDHKPDLEREKARIEQAGLTVVAESFMEDDGTEVTIHKVQKSASNRMAVSRSFGDNEYKANKGLAPEEQAVIAVPEVQVHTRDSETDMFLLLACDGIWDVMSNRDAGRFIVERAKEVDSNAMNKAGRLPQIGDDLLNNCLERGSKDNMTAAVVALSKSTVKFSNLGKIQGKALKFAPFEEEEEEKVTEGRSSAFV